MHRQEEGTMLFISMKKPYLLFFRPSPLLMKSVTKYSAKNNIKKF